MNITRRRFLRLASGGVAATAAAGGTGFVFRDEIAVVQADEIARFLRENFNYLDLRVSDEEMRSFYRDYRKYYRPVFRAHWEKLLKGRDAAFYRGVLDNVATTFLLSTDFFINGADETKPVQYVRFYNAYKSPCWSPLPRNEQLPLT